MIGVVFDGGGVKGSYQVGAYFALLKCGIRPNIITGTSIGSFNAAMCASHKENELKQLWLSVNFANVFGIKENDYNQVMSDTLTDKIKGKYQVYKSLINNSGIDTIGLKKIINMYVSEDELRKSNINFGLATLRINKLETKDVYINDIEPGKLNEYILASAYLPVFKKEKIIDDSNYADGGFYNTCPVNMCIDAGCDTIYVVRTKGIGYTQKIKKNKSKIIYIKSRQNLGSIIFTNQTRCKYNMDLGYYDALKVVKKLDGDHYYIKNRQERTYNLLVRSVDTKLLKKIQKQFKVNNNKKLIIKALEYIMNKEGYDKFKVYGPILLILQIKRINNNSDFVYKFINQLTIF